MWSDDRPGQPSQGRRISPAAASGDWPAAPARRGSAGSGRLELDLEERSPWLEADDEHDEAVDGGRLAGFLLLAVVALALIAAAVWWVAQGAGPGEGDGSLVRAESGPYKVRPEQPGGKTFAGTGDSSYAVSEGERRGAALAAAEALPAPEASSSPAQGGVGVQVGAYMDRESAEAAWAGLVQRAPVLSGFSHRVVEGRADIGTLYRLQVVTGNRRSAAELCDRLRAAGQDCRVKG